MSASVAREGGGRREAIPAVDHHYIDFEVTGQLTVEDLETICSAATEKGVPTTAQVTVFAGGAIVQWDTPIETGGNHDRDHD